MRRKDDPSPRILWNPRRPDGQWMKSCSILTTGPNAVTSPMHDRMPVLLKPDDYDLWLDPGTNIAEELAEFAEALRPSPSMCSGREGPPITINSR